MVLRKLEQGGDPLSVNLDSCEFYVQASGLPITLMHAEMAEVLGHAMGSFLDFDSRPHKDYVGSSLRFRVAIDITKPLRRIIKALGPNQQEIESRIRYERLPNFCYYCGVLGHLVKDCRECINIDNPTGEVNENRLFYGDWLLTVHSAQQPKYVNGSLQMCRGSTQFRRSTTTS